MAEFPLQRFIDLISLDQKIYTLQQDMTTIKEEVARHEVEIKIFSESLERTNHSLIQARKETDIKERAMVELDLAEKEKKRRLDEATDHAQFEALRHEIEHIRKQQAALEEGLIDSWKRYEALQKEYTAKKENTQKSIDALNTAIFEKMQALNALSKQYQEAEASRPVLERGIPAAWLEKYGIMRKSISNPVVPVQQESCSACFYKISRQDLLNLRKRMLIQCKDCYRFLYLTPDSLQEGGTEIPSV